MEKEIKVKQSGITADINTGASVRNVPASGIELPPIEVSQTDIRSRENTGLDLSYNPNSGPVKMNFTKVEGDFGKVVINPEVGQVIINPSVGTVKFNHWK